MEDNKRGTRKRIVHKADGGRAERVDYSTSRSFSDGDRPARKSFGDHKPAGGRKPYGAKSANGGFRKPFKKRDGAKEGMEAMLSRKPQVNGR